MTDPHAPAIGHALSPGAVVAGYRLIRRVSLDAGAAGWLAMPIDGTETVSLSLHGETDAVGRRLRAHALVRSPYVLALHDVATDEDGCIVLVCERTEWTLAALLSARTRLAAGEAVTILAPVVSGLSALHQAGFAHDRLSASTVLFSPEGRPVLGGLEFLRDGDGGTAADVTAGYRALASLIALVAETVDEPAREGLDAVGSWLRECLSDDTVHPGLPGQLECRFFALAHGLPVVLGVDRKSPPAIDADPRRTFSVTSARRAVGALPGIARIMAAVLRSGIGGWAARAIGGRALAVCAGIVVLIGTLVTGLAVVPEASPAAPAPRHVLPTGSTPAPSASEASAPRNTDDIALVSDDVIAATTALLARRRDCLSSGSTGCVSSYAEVGSALADADSHHAIEGGDDGLLIATDARERVEQLQTYGDAVLLRVLGDDEKRQPVLVLAVRTDTGWRLRDVFEPD